MIEPSPALPTFEDYQRNPRVFDEWRKRDRQVQRRNVITMSIFAGSIAVAGMIIYGIALFKLIQSGY